MAARPVDECPYHRPFPDGFRACAAYQPAQYVPLDMHYRVLVPVWTCTHLDVKIVPSTNNRHYGRCRIGDEAARAAYVDELHADRIGVLRVLQESIVAGTAASGAEIWAAKGRQLQAPPGSADQDAATAELRRLAGQLVVAVDAFLEDHAAELARIGMPLDACRELVADMLEEWVTQRHARLPDISAKALDRFPADVRALLRPEVRAVPGGE